MPENRVNEEEMVTSDVTDVVPEKGFDPSKVDDLSSTIDEKQIPENDFAEDEDFADEFENSEDAPTEKTGSTQREKQATTTTRTNSTRRRTATRTRKKKVDEVDTFVSDKMPVVHHEQGIETDPTVESAINRVSMDEAEANNWKEIKGFVNNKSIVWGILTSVQKGLSDNLTDGLYAIVTMPKFPDMQVIIGEDDYWMPTQNFGTQYNSLSKTRQFEKRQRTMEFQIGSRIPMFITTAEKKRVQENDYDSWQTPYTYTIIGNRRKAMEFYQRFWFFSDDTNKKVNKDDTYIANVLQIRPNGVKVECLGVETYISAYELSGRQVVTDCTNCYIDGNKLSIGSKLSVKISKLHIHHKGDPIMDKFGKKTDKFELEDWVYLAVSGRLFDRGYTPKLLKTVTVGSKQLGYVSSVNTRTHNYRILLANGIEAIVNERDLINCSRFDRGDRVLVTITEKLDTFVRGRATKF